MENNIDNLLSRCKYNDVDAKIDAVAALQQAFKSGAQLNEVEEFIGVLKSCLRSSNQHLSAATLGALPPFFQLLSTRDPDGSNTSVDIASLRQALIAFLPAGGLIDRLGDNREKSREKARESLVVLAGLSFRSNSTSLHASARGKEVSKGQETPLVVWERSFREGGLQSKVWRVREQALLTLVEIRRRHLMFPLKPYLSFLVELLEDTDGSVRECARQSVVELFTGPAVTDAARADLKKEMAKKNVRKTIVDSVLQKLMSGGASGPFNVTSPGQSDAASDNAEVPAKKEYIPPSLKLAGRQLASKPPIILSKSVDSVTSLVESGSRPDSCLGRELSSSITAVDLTDVESVYVASIKDLENEFHQMLSYFEGRETEHNWAVRDRSITRLRGMLKGEAHIRFSDTFLAGLRGGIVDATFKTLASLRTTVAVNTCHLYSELTISLGSAIDNLCEPMLIRLVGMASLTKRIVASLSQQVIETIVTYTAPHPKMYLNLLWNALQDKNTSTRQYTINHIKVFLDVHGHRSKHIIEASGSLDVLENSIKRTLGDNNPGIRESARLTFWVFEGIWKSRGEVLFATLDATARKQLEKSCPDSTKSIAPVTPKLKKNSVAAAIAASRARARVTATMPPTLRNQPTSSPNALRSPTTSPTHQGTFEVAVTDRTKISPTHPRSMSPSSPSPRTKSFSPITSNYSAVSPPLLTHGRKHSMDVSTSPSACRHSSNHQMNQSPPSSAAKITDHGTDMQKGSRRDSLDVTAPTTLQSSPPRQIKRARVSGLPSSAAKQDARSSLASLSNREAFSLPCFLHGDDESLLLAQTIPLPEDSESENDSHMLSFSAPYERYHLSLPKTNTSGVSANSPPPNAPGPIVEDALRARAEQAESAAERLLELVEPEDETAISPIPPSLLPNSGLTPKSTKPSNILKSRTNEILPSTPMNKKTAILRQVALFKNSPAHKGSSSLVDILHERKHETGWWLKRISLVDKGGPLGSTDKGSQLEELNKITDVLECGTADVRALKRLALLCLNNPIQNISTQAKSAFAYTDDPFASSVTLEKLSIQSTLWDENKTFDRMFGALMSFLTPERSDEELEYGLIALWEILDNQSTLTERREADIFTQLLQIRFCNKINVLEATNTIRDALVSRVEPVFGLTTLHASLRSFLSEPLPAVGTHETKSMTYAFGLIAFGKFILRLPAEVLEDELPRLKATLTSALSDATSLVVRESAATCIIASQLVLRDETHLFTLLNGLPDEKKNLLTYLFDKHGAREVRDASGTDRLEKEMRRLDNRANTPPRG